MHCYQNQFDAFSNLLNFLISEVSGAVLRVLLPFSPTWMCDAGFSIVTYLKSKYSNRIQTETLSANLCIALSPLTANIDGLIANAQQQKSH